jgi:hypothetical protein
MKRRVFVLLLVCTVSFAFQRAVSTQAPANVSGKWEVKIRMPDSVVTEQWMIQQKGKVITATASSGGKQTPVSGSIDGTFFRVTVKDADKEYKVRATVDGDAMDGSITQAVGREYLWQAKRPKAK